MWRHVRAPRLLAAVLGLTAGLAAAGSPLASGFALREQSGTALGNAFAGATAGAEDPSYMFFNPAALARQQGSQVTSILTYIRPVSKFDTKNAQTAAGVPITGNNGGDGSDDAVLPAFYAVWDLQELVTLVDKLKLGVGVNVPFGLETDYNTGWVGRYHALQSKLKTVNVNPVIAFDPLPGLSLGVGLQVQYASAELSQAVDFGTIAAGIPALAAVAQPTQQDGKARVEGSDFAYGYTLGVLYQPWETTRFGVGYRSHTRHELKGDARFRFDQGGIGALISGASGAFTRTQARAKLDLPETVSFGVHHDLNDRWAVMGETAWTRWSRFDELTITFKNPSQPDSVTDEEWDDTWFFAVGATYRPTEALALRFGAAYDQTPVPNDKRTPRIPDNNRTWLSIGAAYRALPNVTLSAGYTHIFVDDASINLNAADRGSALRGDLSGNFDSMIDLFGVQIQVVF